MTVRYVLHDSTGEFTVAPAKLSLGKIYGSAENNVNNYHIYFIFDLSWMINNAGTVVIHQINVVNWIKMSIEYRINLYIFSYVNAFSFIPLFLHSFIPSFLHSFIPSFLHSFIPLFLYSFIPSFLHSFIPLFLYSFISSFLHFFFPSWAHFLNSFLKFNPIPNPFFFL